MSAKAAASQTSSPSGETPKAEKPINAEDLKNVRREALFPLPEAIESRILPILSDKRDIVMVRLMANISLTMIPAAAGLFYLRSFSNFLGLAYLVTFYVLYLQRFILTLHFSSHKRVFPKNSFFNLYPQYILAPFFGIPSGQYFFHHCVMHHIENNVFPYDVSSTMHYQRDSPIHFAMYWLRYVFAIWVQLPYYLFVRARYALCVQAIVGETFCFLAVGSLWRVSSQATFWVCIMPFCVSSFLLMFGNWSQHIFVNPKNHTDSFNLTYNIINTEMNALTYNDGYHIGHHEHSTLHWSELPNWFNRNLDKLAEKGSITFRELDYVAIGFMCMTGQLDKLANYYVNIGPKETHRSHAEVVAMFKEWFTPIPY